MAKKISATNLVLKIHFPANDKNNLQGKPHCSKFSTSLILNKKYLVS